MAILGLRIYDRALAPGEVDRLAWAERIASLARTPAGKRPGAELDAAFGWWLRSVDPAGEGAAHQAGGARGGGGGHQEHGARSPT